MKFVLLISSLFYLNTTPASTSMVQDNLDESIVAEIIIAAKVTINGKNEGETSTIETAPDGTTRTTIKISCDSFFDMTCYTVEASAQNPEEVTVVSEDLFETGSLVSWNKNKNVVVLDN